MCQNRKKTLIPYFKGGFPVRFSNGIKAGLIFCLFVLLFSWLRIPLSKQALKIEERPLKKKTFKRDPVDTPFYIFSTSVVPYPKNFAPSGYMGDMGDIKMTGSYDVTLKEEYPCLKFSYSPSGKKRWAGIMWQNPANNWGDFDGGYDITRATKLTFWAKGEKGGEVVEFKIGGIAAAYSDSTNLTSGDIALKDKWVKYVIKLEGFPMHFISAGFGFVVAQEENGRGCTFYLDEIKYEN